MIILNFQLFRNVFFIPIFRNVKTFSMNIRHLFIVKISNSHIMDCCYFTTITIDVKPSIATDITTMCKSFICLLFRHRSLLIIYSDLNKLHNISFRQLTYPYMDGFSKFYLQLTLLCICDTIQTIDFSGPIQMSIVIVQPINQKKIYRIFLKTY